MELALIAIIISGTIFLYETFRLICYLSKNRNKGKHKADKGKKPE